jgi:hypothetical protein|nr:MAG TPA: hypothetical protein [Caudoviricetes sp.]
MTEVKSVGQTYQEFMREVRAKQFGRESEVISSITEGTTVKAVEANKPKKTTKKKVEKDSE